jgi:hypothetical protein
MFRSWYRKMAHERMVQAARRRKARLDMELLEDRSVPSGNGLGDVFYIDMENHNFTQPTFLADGTQQLKGNPAAPYLNSLITPGNPNAAQTSWASDYLNVAPGIHPSEPNYVWQEAGVPGTLNDADPYQNTPNNIVNSPNLSGLLQAAGIPWKTYQEDIDLQTSDGSPVNQPGTNALKSTVAPQSQWTVPLIRFSGTSPDYTNPYNGSHQYNFAPKHDGTLFFTDTNGGDNLTPSNPEAKYYAPLQQLQTDLNNNTVARYNLITPDQYNDMHSSLDTNFNYAGQTWTHNTDQESIALGDNFLSKFVPTIMASQAYKQNGAIVIWYDETECGDTSQQRLAEIVISPLAKGNAYKSNVEFTHSSDLKSLEELFGVYAPGGGFLGDANTPGTHDLSSLFKGGALKPTALTGKVFIDEAATGFFQKGDPGVSGLTVTLTGFDEFGQAVNRTTTTAFNGTYSFTGLLPGNYTITITPPAGTENDFTTSTGSLDDITLHGGEHIKDLDLGLLIA